ncbi:MAG: putative rane protein, partial [Clostridia bacterium]|nr:putative rane protein [Clostridia bacterium]
VGAGLIGSLTNTVLVMSGIYLFFGQSYAEVKGISYDVLFGFIMGIVGINGVPEAIVSALITVTVGKTIAPVFIRSIKKENTIK